MGAFHAKLRSEHERVSARVAIHTDYAIARADVENHEVIDTCIWASVFAKAGSPHQQAVERLIDQDRAVLIGPVWTSDHRRRAEA